MVHARHLVAIAAAASLGGAAGLPAAARPAPPRLALAGDVSWTLRATGGTRYELLVQNLSLRSIRRLAWVPPVGRRIIRITSTSRGACAGSGREMTCRARIRKASACGCRPGGSIRIDFAMTTPHDTRTRSGTTIVPPLLGSRLVVTRSSA
jgi:hypothetical protein